MFTDSSWIDAELYARAQPYLNLGFGYHVIFAQRAQIPICVFSVRCHLSYWGGMNLLERFALRAAATFQPTVEQYAQITGLDPSMVASICNRLRRQELLEGESPDTLVASEKGRGVFRRLTEEAEIEREVVGVKSFLGGDVRLLLKEPAFEPFHKDFAGFLTAEAKQSLEVEHLIDVRRLQQVFQGLSADDPYYGYRLLSAECEKARVEISGEPVGLFLIRDVETGRVSVRVFDFSSGLFAPELEAYFDPEQIIVWTGLLVDDAEAVESEAESDKFFREYYEQFLVRVNQVRARHDKEAALPPWELLRDGQIKPRFLEIIEKSQSEILLLSPWVRRFAMEFLLEPLRRAAQRGVRIIVAWGFDEKFTPEIREENRSWARRFRDAKQPGGLPAISFVWTGNHHCKEIIADATLFTIGSFNWLSYAGVAIKDGRIRGESVLVVADRTLAASARDYFVQQVTPALKRDWRYYLKNPEAQLERNICLAVWLQLGMLDDLFSALDKLATGKDARPQLALESLDLVEKTLLNGSTQFDGQRRGKLLEEVRMRKELLLA